MPRFLYPNGGWIASHAHDGQDKFGVESAENAHRYAADMAELDYTTLTEVADDRGEPCTIFPNVYEVEGQPARHERRG